MLTKKLSKLFFAYLTIFVLYACKKSFLDITPRGSLDEATLRDVKGVNGLLLGAYAMLDNYEPTIEHDQFHVTASNSYYGDVGGGVANKGSAFSDGPYIIPVVRHEPDPLSSMNNSQWKVLYEGIKRSNQVLRVLAAITVISDADKKNIEGQARFLRAWYHFQARIIFKHAPFIDVKTDDDLSSGAIQGVSNQDEIFPKILEDVKFAYENVPATQEAIGRINKWNAGAFYGKVLLFTKDFATARPVLNNVVDNGTNPLGVKYELNANYGDNFNVDYDNSKESVFAFQASSQDNAGAGNVNWGELISTPIAAGAGAGFFTPSYFFTNHFKTDAAGLPLANPQTTVVLDPYGQPGYTQYSGNVDPRLDWTIGRNGIPYLDWAVMDHSWIRNDPGGTAPFTSGPFQPKKGTIRQSQIASAHDPTIWFPGGGLSLNANLIRFSDVLLLTAEAETEDPAGSLAKAWSLVNRVRTRAGTTSTVKTYIDNNDPTGGSTNIDAAPYKAAPYPVVFADKDEALKAIRLERLLELGMEGHRFFDLVRWGIAQTELNTFYQYESKFPYAKVLQVPNVPNYQSPAHDYYSVPQRQIDLGYGFTQP